MKLLLTIALLALTVGVKAQTETFKLDSIGSSWSTGTKSFPLLFKIDTAFNYNIRRYNINSQSFQVDTKPLMNISDQQRDGSYNVWIDKSAIKWTSDSTFILKRKP